MSPEKLRVSCGGLRRGLVCFVAWAFVGRGPLSFSGAPVCAAGRWQVHKAYSSLHRRWDRAKTNVCFVVSALLFMRISRQLWPCVRKLFRWVEHESCRSISQPLTVIVPFFLRSRSGQSNRPIDPTSLAVSSLGRCQWLVLLSVIIRQLQPG
jgi:hypothetical protein